MLGQDAGYLFISAGNVQLCSQGCHVDAANAESLLGQFHDSERLADLSTPIIDRVTRQQYIGKTQNIYM